MIVIDIAKIDIKISNEKIWKFLNLFKKNCFKTILVGIYNTFCLFCY